MPYSALVEQASMSHACSHVHGSIAEALKCAEEQARLFGGAVTTVVGAEMGSDGVPRTRSLTAAEQAELDDLRGSA